MCIFPRKMRNLSKQLIMATLPVLSLCSVTSNASTSDAKVRIAFTTDIHGSFFPLNYTTMQPVAGSLARVATAVDSLRAINGPDNLLLLDNGDILQGQPTAYYYNYIDTVAPHLVPSIYNYLGYDAVTIGNHDVETGHPVYDRVRSQTKAPMLGANVIDTSTGEPYLTPYATFTKGGIKITVLGLLTPGIPSWLPEVLWSGLRFDDMTEAARKWIPIIKERENPDIIIGLFHSGHNEAQTTGDVIENASVKVAREVPGFDAVLIGHDHQRFLDKITNVEGKQVHVLNPANNARAIGLVEIIPSASGRPEINSSLLDVTAIAPSQGFMSEFEKQQKEVTKFVTRQIGTNATTISTEDAFFGSSAFMSLLHKLQLEISKADISFAAPLSFDATIHAGPITVSDMFTLYKYENMLYVMELTGREIKNYLEEAYSLWTKQITPDQHHLINFASENPTPADNRLAKPSYNFDSAAGIDYTVDVTKPKGEKISILSLSDGRPFSLDSTYTVAVNSYRANGGGDLLTKGAGIPASELNSRVVRATDKDLRYYLIKEIERNPDLHPVDLANWRFVPETVAKKAIAIDRELLFSPQSSKEQK